MQGAAGLLSLALTEVALGQVRCLPNSFGVCTPDRTARNSRLTPFLSTFVSRRWVRPVMHRGQAIQNAERRPEHRIQADAVAVAEIDLPRRAHRDDFGKSGLVDVKERIRTRMVGNSDLAGPDAAPLVVTSTCSGLMPIVCASCFSASAPSVRFIFGDPMNLATNTFRGRR